MVGNMLAEEAPKLSKCKITTVIEKHFHDLHVTYQEWCATPNEGGSSC